MELELVLHEDVGSLHNIAAPVEHFTEFVELVAVEVLLRILGRENVDIAVAVQGLFVELLYLGLVDTTINYHDYTGGDDRDGNTNGDQSNREYKKGGLFIAKIDLEFLGNQSTTFASVHHIHNHNNPPADSHPIFTNGELEMCVSNLQIFDQSQEENPKGIDDLLTLVEILLNLDRMGGLPTTPHPTNR